LHNRGAPAHLAPSLPTVTTLPMPPSTGLVASPACDAVRDHVFELLDAELAGDAAASLRRHVAHCDACRARLAHEARFLAAVRRTAPIAVAPPALRARLRDELHRTSADDAATDPLAELPVRLTLA